MPSWSDIIEEVKENENNIDIVRYKYLEEYKRITGREVIVYYSAFNSKSVPNLDINDSDMTGITNAMSGLDFDKGLDLILHTPGGSPAAAERIVKYIREKFNDNIRVIVPSQAMSAGTMIAFSAKEIIMTKHACLGPIDPQFNGLAAIDLLDTIVEAKQELEKSPEKSSYWYIELQKYPPAYERLLRKSIELSELLANDWLGSCMFDEKSDQEVINNIVSSFNENKASKIHGRPFDYKHCSECGLKVSLAENHQDYQEALLSLHHCYILLMDNTPTVKIIENSNNKSYQIYTNAS